MAAVVASTLRRRTMQQKQYAAADAKYQASDPEQVALTRTPTKNSSSYRLHSGKSPQHGGGKVTKIFHEDFWPRTISENETNMKLAKFEQFDTLIPRANSWLQDNLEVELKKCETIEKKISCLEQLSSDSNMFIPSHGTIAFYVKGLRLWYAQCSQDVNKIKLLQNSMPLAIGYLNVVPKCLDTKSKYPTYEDLPETYASVNTYMADKPLEGKILTIETVSLKLPCKQWQAPEVDPDATFVADEYAHHIFYITRIYFFFRKPEPELIGAQDFLPDFEQSSRLNSTCSVFPKYLPLANAMNKAAEWLHSARNIHVTNIQTLETVFRNLPENVHTGVTFMKRVDSCVMVRFVRITYTRQRSPMTTTTDDKSKMEEVTDDEDDNNYKAPTGFAYKTFIPAAVKVGMCSGSPEYECFKPMWERSKAWLLCNDRKVLSAESLYHPINCVWHSQDGGETSAIYTNWSHSMIQDVGQRQQLVQLIRVYLDGDYQEPSSEDLPMLPMVEEVNDCRCRLM